MIKKVTSFLVLIGLILFQNPLRAQENHKANSKDKKGMHLVRLDEERKVDVMVDGKLFTSYIYPTSIKKPVLYPITTPQGTKITRKFPLEPSVGERVDHPHHVGLWFNYGDVNGLDFWNNSDAIPEDKRNGYGTIVHKSIDLIEDGKTSCKLGVAMHWISPQGLALLEEKTTFIFTSLPEGMAIDRITQLKAINGDVHFKDNKEGVIGLRVIRALEQPAEKPEIFTDANGLATKVAKLDNEGVHGLYTNAEGIQGDDCWAKRSTWVKLSSFVGDEKITVALLDHPKNVGYPTYWHTRGYGLFAANPLGQAVFSNGKESLNFMLKDGEKTTFRHRLLVASMELTNDYLNKMAKNF